jgi:hypothetical protein
VTPVPDERPSAIVHDIRNKLAIARANVEAFIEGKLTPSPDRLRAVLHSLANIEDLLKDLNSK